MRVGRRVAAGLSAAVLVMGVAACAGDTEAEPEAGPVQEVDPPAGVELSPTTSASASPSAESTAEASGAGDDAGAAAPTVTIDLVDGEPAERPPQNVDVDEGAEVTIAVTSDTPQELHVHGYDEYIEVEPGEPAEASFTADQTGVWEVELHGSGLLLFNLRVR